jgi:hypothetical protein
MRIKIRITIRTTISSRSKFRIGIRFRPGLGLGMKLIGFRLPGLSFRYLTGLQEVPKSLLETSENLPGSLVRYLKLSPGNRNPINFIPNPNPGLNLIPILNLLLLLIVVLIVILILILILTLM